MKYDVAIVGAGPSGYFCAYELVQKNPELKVILLDKGLSIENRHCPVLEHKLTRCPKNAKGYQECFPACSITNGFGGAGAYSDGKFNITSEFGGWLQEYIDQDDLMKLIDYVDQINLKYGATPVITDPYTPEVRDIERRAMSVGLKLLHSKVRHLGTEENLKILTRIYFDLKDKVDCRFSTAVKDVIVKDGQVKGVITDKGEQIDADYVLLAVGREGSAWLTDLFEKFGVEMTQNQVDIGVRVECPNMVMEEINKNLYEGKFIFKASTGSTVRT